MEERICKYCKKRLRPIKQDDENRKYHKTCEKEVQNDLKCMVHWFNSIVDGND